MNDESQRLGLLPPIMKKKPTDIWIYGQSPPIFVLVIFSPNACGGWIGTGWGGPPHGPAWSFQARALQ